MTRTSWKSIAWVAIGSLVLAGCSIPFSLNLVELLGLSSNTFTVTQGTSFQERQGLDAVERGGVSLNDVTISGGSAQADELAQAAIDPQSHPDVAAIQVRVWIGDGDATGAELTADANLWIDGTFDIEEAGAHPDLGPWQYQIPEQSLADATINDDRLEFAASQSFAAAFELTVLDSNGQTQAAFTGTVTLEDLEIHASASII